MSSSRILTKRKLICVVIPTNDSRVDIISTRQGSVRQNVKGKSREQELTGKEVARKIKKKSESARKETKQYWTVPWSRARCCIIIKTFKKISAFRCLNYKSDCNQSISISIYFAALYVVLRLHSAGSPHWREGNINSPFCDEFVTLQSTSDYAIFEHRF